MNIPKEVIDKTTNMDRRDFIKVSTVLTALSSNLADVDKVVKLKGSGKMDPREFTFRMETFKQQIKSASDSIRKLGDFTGVFNLDKIHNAVDELAQDAVKELEKELKKAMKKWKF